MFHNFRECRPLVITTLALAVVSTARADDATPLSGAVIRGSSVYSPVELFGTYRAELGRPLDRASARAVIAAVQAMYVRDGYSQPEIRADHALLEQGILRLEVIEPRITDIRIDGDTGPYRKTLDALAARLRNMQPVRRAEVQRVLGRMRELPGLSVSAATRRDESQHDGYVIEVDASFDPVEGMVRVSNRGTDAVGPTFVTAQTVANGMFARERVGLLLTSAASVDEYRGGGVFLDAPLGARGTRAFLLGFGSSSEPGIEPGEPVDRYLRQRLTLRITHPLARAGRVDLALQGALDAEDFEIRRDGAELREERLRVLQVGSRASWRAGQRTRYHATLDVRQGLDALGSGLQAPDLAEDPRRADFLLTRLQLVRLTNLNELWSVRLDALAQYSGYVLPYSERFKIGGDRLGRGFEVTEIAGDRGAGAKLELRRAFANTSALLGKPSVYAFYDIGAAWTQDVGGRASAATAGFGIAAQAGALTGYLELAKPLTRADVEGRKSASVFVEVSLPF